MLSKSAQPAHAMSYQPTGEEQTAEEKSAAGVGSHVERQGEARRTSSCPVPPRALAMPRTALRQHALKERQCGVPGHVSKSRRRECRGERKLRKGQDTARDSPHVARLRTEARDSRRAWPRPARNVQRCATAGEASSRVLSKAKKTRRLRHAPSSKRRHEERQAPPWVGLAFLHGRPDRCTQLPCQHTRRRNTTAPRRCFGSYKDSPPRHDGTAAFDSLTAIHKKGKGACKTWLAKLIRSGDPDTLNIDRTN
jgi:hypothetical protein